MTPTHDSIHEGRANSEVESDLSDTATTFVHDAHLRNVLIANFGLGPDVQAHGRSVPFVVGCGGPFEIGHGVISFDAIDMVDLWEVVRVRNECHGDKPMDQASVNLAACSEAKVRILLRPIAGVSDAENLPHPAMGATDFIDYDAVETADATKIADFVHPMQFRDWYRSPFFVADDIHVAGFLSGDDGLKIKDPLHASTFGGSAIMASGSTTYNRSILCP